MPLNANQIHRKFIFAADPAEILAELDGLDASNEIAALPRAEELELRLSALRSLRRLAPNDASARDWIVKRLLPLCISLEKSDDFGTRIALTESRKLAGEWLNETRGAEGEVILAASIAYLSAQLDSSPHRRAVCWTLSEIGFRTPALVTQLFGLLSDVDEQNGDIALETIAALGVTGADRERCLQESLSRASRRITSGVAAALVALPDPRTIPVLSDVWLTREESQPETERELLFSMFAQIGAQLSEPEAIDQACNAITGLHAGSPAAFDRRLRLASNVLPHLDTPLAPQYLASLLPAESEATEYDRWLVMLRLEECMRPRQLAEMTVSPALQQQLAGTLISELKEPGETTARERTARGDLKIASLRTAFWLEQPDVQTWLGPALAGDQNPYVQNDIMEIYACIRVHPLPEPIPEYITDKKDLGTGPADDVELLLRLAASRVARSADSQEAFGLLLTPGLTRKGSVMLETVEGLVSATLALGKQPVHRDAVLSQLFEALSAPVSSVQVSAVCRAISAAANRGWLADEPWRSRASSLLGQPPPGSAEIFDLASIASAIAALPRQTLSGDFVETLTRWGRERDDRLGWRALQLLVELGQFSAQEEWIAPKLGLRRVVDQDAWDWAVDAPGLVEWAPLLIASLYVQSPRDFTPALCSVLADQRWFPSYDVPGVMLDLLHDERPIEQPVADALFGRVRQRNSSRFADAEILRRCAALCPERFALEDWSASWQDWMSESRTTLASTLGGLPHARISAEARRHAAALLALLGHDGEFAVRRAAFRGLVRLLPEQLGALGDALSSHESSVEERAVAAEMLAWLPDPGECAERLATDVSKRVRDAAGEALETRRRRAWAQDYLARILALREPTNLEILENWKYGNALSRTGDDEAIEVLREHLQKEELASCVRFRLAKVLKDMEKHWEVLTKKWPKPMLPLPGSIETISAKLTRGDRSYDAVCTFWHVTPTDIDSLPRWGGMAEARDAGAVLVILFGQTAAVRLADGRVAEVFIHGVSSEGLASFRGVGAYPSIVSAAID